MLLCKTPSHPGSRAKENFVPALPLQQEVRAVDHIPRLFASQIVVQLPDTTLSQDIVLRRNKRERRYRDPLGFLDH